VNADAFVQLLLHAKEVAQLVWFIHAKTIKEAPGGR
jgi:hypothetical protein